MAPSPTFEWDLIRSAWRPIPIIAPVASRRALPIKIWRDPPTVSTLSANRAERLHDPTGKVEIWQYTEPHGSVQLAEMRMTIVQLSDIHFVNAQNWIANKVDQIVGAAWAADTTATAYLIAFTGDIAFSGKEAEYASARQFVSELVGAFKSRTGGPMVIMTFIPGNHDCDFDRETDTRTMALKHLAAELPSLDPQGDVVQQCLSVQDRFFAFVESQSGAPSLSASDRLFHTEDYEIGGVLVRFNLYNTAWISRKLEKQGELLFPTHIIEPKLAGIRPAQLTISLLHHPYNWLAASNAREFRRIVESISDIVLTGHEHEPSAYTKDLFPTRSLQYFEAPVLQGGAGESSGFNVLHIDTSSATSRISVFSWKSGMYQSDGEPHDWEPLNRSHAGSTFPLKADYERHLQDVGTGFTHPYFKGELRREHLFIYPDLLRRSLHKRQRSSSPAAHTIEGKDVVNTIWEQKQVLLSGSDLAGKTSLARSLFLDLKSIYGAVPVLISGVGLTATNETEVRRVLDAGITEQYGTPQREAIYQLSPDRKVLIIDDMDHCGLSAKGQKLFLDVVRTQFERIIIMADEFFALEELSQESDDARLFGDFENLEIREFGYYLRGKLIEKWVTLGREHLVSKADLDHEVANHEQLISTLLGRNLLPSHPLIILTVLQAWESTQTHDIATGSYGYLYEMLILEALSKVSFRAPDIDVTMTFLAGVAHHMFVEDQDSLTDATLRRLSTEYFEFYRTRLPDDLFDKLVEARVLSRTGSEYSFRYPYYFYFFVARFLRDNMNVESKREVLSQYVHEMADHIHYERYANVLSFYIYLSKDISAIRAIIDNARRIYDEFEPCDFDQGVAFYNRLYLNRGPSEHLQLPAASPEANRDEYRKELDRAREEELYEVPPTIARSDRNDKLRYDKQLSDIIKVNIANKTLQIMGQVVRNSPGSIPGSIKHEVAQEAYALGLRTLTAVLNIAITNLDSLRRYVRELVREYRASRRMPELVESDLLKAADEGIIHLGQAFGFGMIRRISQAVGLRQLEETYAEVLKDYGHRTSGNLVDLAIKLDHFPSAPVSAIKELERRLTNTRNYYSYKVLQDLVYCYLYIHNVDYKTRSQLMSWFKIRGGAAKSLIENPSKRQKRLST